jgi:hypothetical protein
MSSVQTSVANVVLGRMGAGVPFVDFLNDGTALYPSIAWSHPIAHPR